MAHKPQGASVTLKRFLHGGVIGQHLPPNPEGQRQSFVKSLFLDQSPIADAGWGLIPARLHVALRIVRTLLTLPLQQGDVSRKDSFFIFPFVFVFRQMQHSWRLFTGDLLFQNVFFFCFCDM